MSKLKQPIALAGAMIFLACSLGADGARAQGADHSSEANPLVVDMKAPAAERTAAAAALLQKAARRGEVRVIVGLRTALEPPHTLSAAEAGRRSQRLRAAQDAVL